MTAIAACRTCGTEHLEHARFCHGCGLPVKDSETRAEYKQVTVLFADVVHSMNIAATVGWSGCARSWPNSSTSRQRWCNAAAARWTSSPVTASWRCSASPVAMEDHAVRACRAALGIQDATVRLAAQVKHRDGIDLWLRVGLNSGQVIAGEVGSTSLGYTAIGEQVGMAQRMESVAPPGGVMVSASTARLVEDAVALRCG